MSSWTMPPLRHGAARGQYGEASGEMQDGLGSRGGAAPLTGDNGCIGLDWMETTTRRGRKREARTSVGWSEVGVGLGG